MLDAVILEPAFGGSCVKTIQELESKVRKPCGTDVDGAPRCQRIRWQERVRDYHITRQLRCRRAVRENSHRSLYDAQYSTQTVYADPATALRRTAPQVETGGLYFFSRTKKSAHSSINNDPNRIHRRLTDD